MYYIENITNQYGETRSDDRYPNRIGSVTEMIVQPRIGYKMIFRYIKRDNNGNIIADHITQTSPVTDIKKENDNLIVYTINSIYYLKKIKDGE